VYLVWVFRDRVWH